MNCFYCNIDKRIPFSIMNNSNIEKIIYCAKEIYGINEVVYTGGEPLLADNLAGLIVNIGTKYSSIIQVVETNGSRPEIVQEIVEKRRGPVEFQLSLPTINEKILEKISPQWELSNVKKSISILKDNRIRTEVHCLLLKNQNCSENLLKQYIEFFHNKNMDVYFDELRYPDYEMRNLRAYSVHQNEFENALYSLGYRKHNEIDGLIEYRWNGKKVFYKKKNYDKSSNEYMVLVSPDGYIRKDSFLDDIHQIHISNMSRKNILDKMREFRTKYG